jgi:hypothetical protein
VVRRIDPRELASNAAYDHLAVVDCRLFVDGNHVLRLEQNEELIKLATSDLSPKRAISKLKLSTGESGPFMKTDSRSLHRTRRMLNLKIENMDDEQAVTGIEIGIRAIEPQTEYVGPWVLASDLSLAAGAQKFIPMVSYGEAKNSHHYSTSGYDRSDSFFEVLTTANQPKPLKQTPQFISIRATGFGSAPCDYRCRVWVDQSEARLRVEDAD